MLLKEDDPQILDTLLGIWSILIPENEADLIPVIHTSLQDYSISPCYTFIPQHDISACRYQTLSTPIKELLLFKPEAERYAS